MPVDKEKHTQILVTFPNELVSLIEEHWHKERLKNRSEAIRDLVTKGLGIKLEDVEHKG